MKVSSISDLTGELEYIEMARDGMAVQSDFPYSMMATGISTYF